MRTSGLRVAVVVVLVLPAAHAVASGRSWAVDNDFGGTAVEDDIYAGPYLGAEFGGASAGALTMSGVAGYNWASLTATNLIFGVQSTLGISLPTNTFEVWGWGRGGLPLDNNMWAYGTGGLGLVDGTPSYAVGAGTQIALGGNFGLDLTATARGPVGAAPGGATVTATLDYFPENSLGGAVRAPALDAILNSGSRVEAGASLGVVSGGAVVIPSANLQVLFPSGHGIDVGLRGSLGVESPTGKPELFTGGQVGIEPANKWGLYAFTDLGVVGTSPVNVLGLGGSVRLTPQWSVKSELFGRGSIGSLSETGVRLGVYYDIFGPIAAGQGPGS